MKSNLFRDVGRHGPRPTLRFGRRRVGLPHRRLHRASIGILLLIGGLLWFLPVFGLWMIPLGVLVLSVDFHLVRRFRRRFDSRLGRMRRRVRLPRQGWPFVRGRT